VVWPDRSETHASERRALLNTARLVADNQCPPVAPGHFATVLKRILRPRTCQFILTQLFLDFLGGLVFMDRPGFGPPRAWAYYGAALAVALLFASLSAWVVWEDRSETYASERRALLNTARLVADNLGESFDQIDALLKSVGRLYADGQESGPEEKARLADFMTKEIADHPIAARIYVADSEGKIVVGGGAFAAAPTSFNLADAAFFKRAAAGDQGLIFEGPVEARFGDGWVIVLSRRLDNGKGEFLGAVSASITVESLTRLFSTLETVDKGAVALWTDAGVLVARYPRDLDAEAQVGAEIMPERAKRRLREQPQNQDVYSAVTQFDGVVRLIASQKVRNTPYLVFCGSPKVALDGSWWRAALALGLLCATIAVAAFWTARRQLAWTALLEEDKRRLERRVAERTAELETLNASLADRVEREVRTRQSAQARLAQNEKMAALGQLASGVAHDFNGVLQTVLIGAATVGRRPDDPDLARSVAATIERAATRSPSRAAPNRAARGWTSLRSSPGSPRC
jgi:C4-dicarboxylate-specific signal transduction histidine kinase